MNTLPLVGRPTLIAAALFAGTLVCHGGESSASLTQLATLAVSGTDSAAATAALRRSGQPGLDAVLAANPTLIASMRDGSLPLDHPQAVAIRAVVEKVARQRDAHASALYWYTDIEEAKAAATASSRHILSLRLLGNLDEEYSCANSRFFRTVLYANAEVSRHLREHYILHWKSVRPAPIVTIDMGDGRRIKRTITGNSIHYILDAKGTVLDALPGLYGPKPFLAALLKSENLASYDPEHIRSWHGLEADALCRQWLTDAVDAGMYGDKFSTLYRSGNEDDLAGCLRRAFPPLFGPFSPRRSQQNRTSNKVTQQAIATLLQGTDKFTEFDPPAVAKSMVERPISRQTAPMQAPSKPATPAPPNPDGQPLVNRMTDDWWRKLSQLPAHGVELDEASQRLMMAKLPRNSVTENERKSGRAADPQTPFGRTLVRFHAAIAQDTVHNEYLFHTQIHQWLENDESDTLRRDMEGLNRRVYSELFLTPDHDAWLGMVPDDTYTALEKDGCACDPGAPPMR